ncbi:AbrB family transcriptional regulator [Limimaricola sp.]|uniref:AbrB family transcriptional regulator n=1 Tax=Limimaricola sp. TaxID=2211665 RepID=UPI0025C34B8C|nr:AbrB family transcriptional regulator [Limimaricola sp.]
MQGRRAEVAALVMTLAVSGTGVVLFRVAHLPLPWLLGPMLGCLVAALAGLPLRGAPRASMVMRTILGVAVGASITPALVHRLPQMTASLAMMPLLVVAVGAVGYPLFRRVFGFDHPTSYYAAMPGGLQDMLVFGAEAGGDMRALGLIHATRVLIVVSLLPLVFAYILGVDMSRPPGLPAADIPVVELALMAAAAILGWQGAQAVGLFGATILGPMIAAAALSLGGIISHRPPAEAITAAQFFIGFTVGVKYTGITPREVRRVVGAGVVFSLLTLVIAVGFAGVAIWLHVVPPVEGLLSFSPGGQAEMAVLAIVAGADVAFVVSHHVVRIVIVILGAPIVARRLR